MRYVLAIDQGTHASRALVFSADGVVVGRSGQHEIPLSRPAPGRVEQDGAAILASVRLAIREALQTLAPEMRARVDRCGMTTQRSTVVAWDPDGQARSPAINWQDTRGAALVETLQPQAAEIRSISGLPLSPHYGASKLHWLFGHTGNGGSTLAGPLASFLVHNLTRERHYCTDHTNAQRMQLLDLTSLDWSARLTGHFRIPAERLPVCRPVLDDYGVLAGHDIPLTAVCGDQNAAWSGGGTPQPDTLMINLGSGAFILAEHRGHDSDPRLLTSIAWSDATDCSLLLEATVNGAGNALTWLGERGKIDALEQNLPKWLEAVDTPPLFLNTVGGLGSPWWRSGPEPGFVDDHGQYTPAERAAGVIESIVFLIQHNLELMDSGRTAARLRVSGGLSRLDALCSKLASLSGLPVERCDDTEASARGVAWLAAGRPAEWRDEYPAARFLPQASPPLQARYRAFITQLKQRLDDT